MNSNSRHEVSLKLICSLTMAGSCFFIGWPAFFIGLFALGFFWSFYLRLSTQWLLKSLDLRPDSPDAKLSLPNKYADQVAQRHGMPSPKFYILKTPLPIIMGFGRKKSPILVVGQNFFNKLSQSEKLALLELAVFKIQTKFAQRIEFVTLVSLALLNIGSKLDFFVAFITGLKNKKNHAQRNYMIFSRLLTPVIRLINIIYIRKNFFYKIDEELYQDNPCLLLAFKKAQLYTPQDNQSLEPLLYAFNFTNIPCQANWENKLQRQPALSARIETLQKDKNLMVESLTFS